MNEINSKKTSANVPKKYFDLNPLDFWEAFKKCWWIMIIAAIITVTTFVVYARQTYVPSYSSTSTLYILFEGKTQDSLSGAYSLAMSLVTDCNYALKSQPCVEQAVSELNEKGYDVSYSALLNSIYTDNPDSTRYINVTCIADTPEHAKAYVDQICKTCQEQMAKAAADNQQVNIYSEGTLNTSPCNQVVETSYLKYGAVAAAVIYAAFVVFRVLEDKFNDDTDIENTLGVTLLGTLPNADVSQNKIFGKKSKYGKYSKYGDYGKTYNKSYGYYAHTPQEKDNAADEGNEGENNG